MELIVTALIPALLGILAIRLMVMPMQWVFRLLIHALGGFLCLWILNTVSGYTGVYIPMNAVTAAVAGFGGIPGIGLLAFIEVL